MRPISNHSDGTSLVNKGFIIWKKNTIFLRHYIPCLVHLACSQSISQILNRDKTSSHVHLESLQQIDSLCFIIHIKIAEKPKCTSGTRGEFGKLQSHQAI